jgi:hypothetical protein
MDLLFHYKGHIYEAKVLVNYSEAIHYYRCYFSDPELKKEGGECVTFKANENSGRLELVYYADKRAYILINSLQESLQQYINTNSDNETATST